MSAFGPESLAVAATLHPIWQQILHEAIKSEYFDFSIVEGYRPNNMQQLMFDTGKSKARPGQSAHNYMPSFGVDLTPYPTGYKDGQAMLLLAGHIISTAERLGYEVTCGCDWDRDASVIDTNFRDFWHFELTDWRKMR
jgi:peptidoglycan L-alanyl-D-glutamate endopeptidase CwlK